MDEPACTLLMDVHDDDAGSGRELMEYVCNKNNQDVEHIEGPANL